MVAGTLIMPVLIANRQNIRRINSVRIRKVLLEVMTWLNCAEREVSVLLLDNAGIQVINRDYLHRDRPTNVISFAMQEGEFADINPHVLGDIIISVEKTLTDSHREGIKFTDEFDFLLIHGLLHLLGFDHENVDETMANKMQTLEKKIFSRLKGYTIH